MILSHQLGQVGWRSSLWPSIFHLLGHFHVPQNAIKQSFLTIGGSSGSNWLDLSGFWMDLGGIHPGWSAGAIWTHRSYRTAICYIYGKTIVQQYADWK